MRSININGCTCVANAVTQLYFVTFIDATLSCLYLASHFVWSARRSFVYVLNGDLISLVVRLFVCQEGTVRPEEQPEKKMLTDSLHIYLRYKK